MAHSIEPMPQIESLVPQAEAFQRIDTDEMSYLGRIASCDAYDPELVAVSGKNFRRIGENGDHLSGIYRKMVQKLRGESLGIDVERRRRIMVGAVNATTKWPTEIDYRSRLFRLVEEYEDSVPLREAAEHLWQSIIQVHDERVAKQVSDANQAYLEEDEPLFVQMSKQGFKSYMSDRSYFTDLAGFAIAADQPDGLMRVEVLVADGQGRSCRLPEGLQADGLWIETARQY